MNDLGKTRRPNFITFTGFDDWTDIDEMVALSEQYPIEWGVLFSEKAQGIHPRYPSLKSVEKMYNAYYEFVLSAHLCGAYTKRIMTGEAGNIAPPFDIALWNRIQVNHSDPDIDILKNFNDQVGPHVITQIRGNFPKESPGINLLYDPSGGTGKESVDWPKHPGYFVGYAGGIGPDNVDDVLTKIEATGPFWIDMESKVRTDDRFDLKKVRQVCQIVYDTEI